MTDIRMIPDSLSKVNQWFKDNTWRLLLTGLMFAIVVSAFGLGRLSVLWSENHKIRIIEPKNDTQASDSADRGGETATPAGEEAVPVEPLTASAVVAGAKGKYIASKSGTAYHYPWCPGAQKIKESNKIWFLTKQEAESKGYKPAANCPGL